MRRNTSWLSRNEHCEKHEGSGGNRMWRKPGEITEGLCAKVAVGLTKSTATVVGIYVSKGVSG